MSQIIGYELFELIPKTENIVYLVGENEELGKILASILIKSRN